VIAEFLGHPAGTTFRAQPLDGSADFGSCDLG